MKSILSVIFVTALLTGCDSQRMANDSLLKQEGNLNKTYLNGTRDEARQSLLEVVRLIESSHVSPESDSDRAAMLYLAYGRLYVLERRETRFDLAQLYLIKARYWCLRRDELLGDSPAGCTAYLAKMATEAKLADWVNKVDEGANSGKGPKYTQSP